jgi:hypothetical protein
MIVESLIKIISTPVAAVQMTVIPGVSPMTIGFSNFYDRLLVISVGVAVFTAITLVSTAGYQMMMSSGEAEALKKARAQIANAIMGLLLILMAVFLVRTIFEMLGISGFIN